MVDIPIRTEFPRTIREIENSWIPMPDGIRLAVRIWLPQDAEDDPVPAILEYLPYRKRDGTVVRDHLTHPYFAGHGYASVRVDMRGTGDSEGVCLGEYLEQEQDDAQAVIDWLAKQPWCSGKVGMIGISWGGFNGLQVAARQPEALAAVITLCSTDDRYADDIHFMGGAMLTDKLAWGGTAFLVANTPPDPAIVGDRWRDMWKERLEANGLWMLDWFRHQRRDGFYAHGSICEDWSKVQVPVYAVGGYADGYTNPILRMMEYLAGPRKALIGPWAHKYPHFAVPGPRIGFLQEALRWWDQHLKSIETGVMDEPMIRAWMQDATAPTPAHIERPGHWMGLESWPVAAVETVLHVTAGGLRAAPDDSRVTISSPETTGWTAQSWCAYGATADGPLDQNGEAGLATVFESAALEADMAIFGHPVLDLHVASDVQQANLAAILSMVAPEGPATFITYGVLNLTHRTSHSDPEPMPDGPVPVSLKLNVIGQTVPAGYRLRLALSSAYWPILWPSAQKATLTIGAARLTLPHPPQDAVSDLPAFPDAEGAAPAPLKSMQAGADDRRREIDFHSGVETYRRHSDLGGTLHEHTGLVMTGHSDEVFTIHPDDPNSAQGRSTWHWGAAREDWRATLDTSVTVSALVDVWRIKAKLTARDADGEVLTRTWHEDVPRDLV